MKYIDAVRLRARIEKDLAFDNSIDTAYYKGRRDAEWNILTLIDSLRQEQPHWKPSESEDERIAEELIKALRGISTGLQYAIFLTEEKKQRWLSWLEKQKEQKPNIEICPHSIKSKSYMEKPAEWSEEDEAMLQSIIKDFRAGKVSTIGQEQWLKSLLSRPKSSDNWLEEEITGMYQALFGTDIINRKERLHLDTFEAIARHFYGLRNRALEEAARHVYESWMGDTMGDVRRDMVTLGTVLNARKEE